MEGWGDLVNVYKYAVGGNEEDFSQYTMTGQEAMGTH